MRPVQIYLAMRKRSVNLNSRETAMAFAYPRDVRNSEAAIQFRQVQNCIHIAFVAKSENSSRVMLVATCTSYTCKPTTNFQTTISLEKAAIPVEIASPP